MRKELGNKPFTYPQPVLMIGTFDEDGTPDLMNAAWGGISNDDEISICLSSNHKTVYNFMKTKAMTISMATKATVKECDYLGIASGNKVKNKIDVVGFHYSKAPHVNAPIFDELPLTLECALISYDNESCRMVARIVNVLADESILGENGKVDPKKLEPICFDPFNNSYLVVSEKIDDAFKCGTVFMKK